MLINNLQNISNLTRTDPNALKDRVEKINPKNISDSKLSKKEDEALLKVCQDFESVFVGMMYKAMKKTVPENSFIEKSNGTKIFEEMYLDELAKENAKTSTYGIAKMLYDQFQYQSKNIVSAEEIQAKLNE